MARNQGIKSKNVKHTTAPKTEPRSHAKVVAGVAQIGTAQGNHVTEQGSTGYGGVSPNAGRGFQPVGDGERPKGPRPNCCALWIAGHSQRTCRWQSQTRRRAVGWMGTEVTTNSTEISTEISGETNGS
jgi:hypothetical protein